MFKKIFYFSLFLVLNVCLNSIYAQISVQDLLSSINDSAKRIEEDGGQILLINIDNIDFKQEKTTYYTLKAESKYGIMAIGDNERISNIDLSVSDDKAYPVGVDNSVLNTAIVKVQPKHEGIFVIHVKASAMVGKIKDGFFGLIIFRYPPKEKITID